MVQMGFCFDMRSCIGCKACQVACKDKNCLGTGVFFRKVQTFEGGKFPRPWFYHLSLACNHCQRPACMESCPVDALQKRTEDGLVLLDKEKCIGCGSCVGACPYGAMEYLDEEGKAGKCDLCEQLTSKGEEPACAAACVMRSLTYGPLDVLRHSGGNLADVKGMPNSSETGPSLVIIPSREVS
ncbi:MAG: 4Fe-4S dicluster domain-containing protein [Bacillota bacterium]